MSPLRLPILLSLLPLLLCLLLVVDVSKCAPNPPEDFTILPRPNPQRRGDMAKDFAPNDDDRYVGYCTEKLVMMIPGKSRNFWSYGYVHLKEAYPANCTLKYTFTTKSHPPDTFAKFGYRITGSFVGPNIVYSSCTDTDYVTLNDTEGITATYCGTNAAISFETGSDYFEFYFKSQENSPRALGFFVTIESFYLCGGLITSTTHGPTGVITSPLHTTAYPPNSNCAWWFTSSDETTIKMECSSFLLEDQITFPNGTSYCPDYLSVSFEALTPTTTSIYCDSDMNTLSRTIYSAGNSMLVNFRSDSANHFSGFNCTYDFIKFST